MIVTEVGDATYLGQIARKLTAGEGEDEEEEAAAPDTTEQPRSAEADHFQGADAAPAEAEEPGGADFSDRLYRRPTHLPRPAGSWHVLRATRKRSFGRSPARMPCKVAQSLLNYFVYMVIIIVVAVPEGLPMSVTVSLALAMQKMTRANSLVRQLVACETIGSATVICSDKTGTLTQNKMQVVRLFWDGVTHDRDTPAWAQPDAASPWPRDGQPLDWIVLNAAADSTANLEEKRGHAPVVVGNPTEGALLQWLAESGLNYHKLRGQFPPIYQIPLFLRTKADDDGGPGRRPPRRAGEGFAGVVAGAQHALPGGRWRGARVDGGGTGSGAGGAARLVRPGHANAGLRPRGAAADFPADAEGQAWRRDALEPGLVFDGFIAIRDPLRPDVNEAVAKCRAAGIEVKMITGDNVETARAIAFDVGLIDRRDAAIDEPGRAC